MTRGIIGLSFLLAPVKASWLMLCSSLLVVRLVFDGKEDALVLDLSKDEVGLLVDGTLGSCRRFLEPGLPTKSADILCALLAYTRLASSPWFIQNALSEHHDTVSTFKFGETRPLFISASRYIIFYTYAR